MLMIIDDDREWTKYYQNLFSDLPVEIYHDSVAAIDRLNKKIPDAILLDILLIGPTGFSFLNELQSHPELAKIPIIIVSSIDLKAKDLQKYGVLQVFNKSTMLPQELKDTVKRFNFRPISDSATDFNHKQEFSPL